jgi:hypothetical protein
MLSSYRFFRLNTIFSASGKSSLPAHCTKWVDFFTLSLLVDLPIIIFLGSIFFVISNCLMRYFIRASSLALENYVSYEVIFNEQNLTSSLQMCITGSGNNYKSSLKMFFSKL